MENRISFGLYELSVLSFTLLSISVVNYYYKFYTRKNPFPAPFPLPLIGHFFDNFIYSSNFSEYCHLLQSKYGDIFEQWYGSERIIFINNLEYADRLLSSSTKSKYLTRVPNPEGLKELGAFGKGILFNHDVDSWRFNRQFFTQAMLTSNFLKESTICTQTVFNEMEEYWKLGLEDDTITNFSEWSHSLTTDVIFQMITGKKTWAIASYFSTVSPRPKSVKLQKFDEKVIGESSKLSKAFQTYIKGINFFIYTPKWIRNYIPGYRATRKEVLKERDFLFEKLDDIIQERRKEIENTPKDEKLRNDMLTLLITSNTDRSISDIKDINKEYTKPLTDEEIRGIIVEALGGGIDTTANVFTFAIYYLSHHPDVKNRLLQEIDDFFDQNKNGTITYNDLPRLTYCEAVIKEVSRLMATVHLIARVSSEPDSIGNIEWDAGTRFVIFVPGIHLNEKYWEKPQKFNVDRFIDNDEQKQQSEKNRLIMWGGGLRQCPGRKLAMVELKCLLVLVFRNWDIELANMDSPLNYEVELITSSKDLNVKIRPRHDKMKNV